MSGWITSKRGKEDDEDLSESLTQRLDLAEENRLLNTGYETVIQKPAFGYPLQRQSRQNSTSGTARSSLSSELALIKNVQTNSSVPDVEAHSQTKPDNIKGKQKATDKSAPSLTQRAKHPWAFGRVVEDRSAGKSHETKPGMMDRQLRQNKPRLLLMGQRRSGKSSITSVVFHKMPPQETLFLESTTRIQKDTMNSFMDFQVWDFPGQLDYFDPAFDTTEIFSEIGALVWVIDAQDEYSESLNRLTTTILNLQSTFPQINVEVFVHKIDSLNDEFKADIFQDIVQRVGDELSDAGYINPNVNYHLTSIYDYSIFEAFSKVIQKLIPQLDTLQNLLNVLVNSSGMSKAYLFDILSKIYVASDTRPIDMEVYEMCSDYIDVIVDITDLYGYPRNHGVTLGEQMEEAESSITIHDGTMIYLKEMNRYLCLVTVIKNREAKEKKGLIDYNCHMFQDALTEVFARSWEKIRSEPNGDARDEVRSSSTSVAEARLQAQLE